jgi:hypothetical protein
MQCLLENGFLMHGLQAIFAGACRINALGYQGF